MAAKQGSVQAIIDVAKKEIGTIEGPKDNETKELWAKWSRQGENLRRHRYRDCRTDDAENRR